MKFKKIWPAILAFILAELFLYIMWQSGGHTKLQTQNLAGVLALSCGYLGFVLFHTSSNAWMRLIGIITWLGIYFIASWYKITQHAEEIAWICFPITGATLLFGLVMKKK